MSVKTFLLLPLALLLLSAVRVPAPTLAWDAYPFPAAIAGIRIYSGPNANPALGGGVVVTNVAPTAVTVAVSATAPGAVHFQAVAFNSLGLESLPSNDVIWNGPFVGPSNLRVGP